MNRSIVGRLIAKDLYLYRGLIAAALLAGVAALVVSRFSEGDNVTTGLNLGFLLFMTTIIAFGIGIVMLGILKERKDKSLLFVLSLPISATQYALVESRFRRSVAFLVPWLALTAGVVVLTAVTDLPAGGLPFFVAMMAFFLANFCVLLAVIAVTQSELWAVVGILVTNLSVTLFLVNVGKLPGVAGRAEDAAATWSPEILTVLGLEAALILLSLGLAFFSRRARRTSSEEPPDERPRPLPRPRRGARVRAAARHRAARDDVVLPLPPGAGRLAEHDARRHRSTSSTSSA